MSDVDSATRSRLALLRAALAPPRDDPYAGADPATARRLTALLVLLVTILTLAYAPMDPPTDMIGGWGWVVLAAITLGDLAAVRWLARATGGVTFNRMLAISYAGGVSVVVLEWLSGGHSAYAALFMLWLGSG